MLLANSTQHLARSRLWVLTLNRRSFSMFNNRCSTYAVSTSNIHRQCTNQMQGYITPLGACALGVRCLSDRGQNVDLAPMVSQGDGTLALKPGFLPEPPEMSSITEFSLNALGEPSLASLGLCSYWPSGWIQSLLEAIHVYGSLPWFASIMCLTLCVRMMALPLTVMQLKNAALMHNILPGLQRLQAEQVEAMRSGDVGRAHEAGRRLTEYMQTNNFKPTMFLRPLIMAPVFLSVYYGIHGITSLPVQSMMTGGALWFPNLTVADPYMILPALSAASVWLVTKTGAEGGNVSQLPPQVKLFFNILPVGIFLFTAFQPSALALYWTTSNFISLIYAQLFSTPAMRRVFNIPEKIQHPEPKEAKPSRSDFSTDFHDFRKVSQLMHELEDRKRTEAIKFGQSDMSKAWQEPKVKHINIGLDPEKILAKDSKQGHSTDLKGTQGYDPSKPRLSKSDFRSRSLDTRQQSRDEKE